MKIATASLIKIIVLVAIGIAFGSVMIVYSNSRHNDRGWNGRHERSAASMEATSSGDRHIEKSFPVAPGGTLKLDSDVGDVEIEGSDGNTVNVVVDIAGDESRAEKFHVDMTSSGNDVTVTGKVDESGFFRWDSGNLDVHYRVTVPKKYTITGSTAGGDVRVKNVEGEVRYGTSGGDMNISSISGRADVSTSGGTVEATDVTGPVKFETSGGEVKAERVQGDIEAGTSGGDVTLLDVDGALRAETSGGNVEVSLRGDNRGIDLHTSGGNIIIHLPSGTKADLDASSSGGRVTCDLPVTVSGEMDENEVRGQLNGGGKPIRAETSGGNIRVLERK